MASAFLAMNQVFGEVYDIDSVEAEDQTAACERHDKTTDQFIFDVHTHHVHDNYSWDGILWLRDTARGNNQAKKAWNPDLAELELDLKYYKFDYYLKDMFFDSDTAVALLSTSRRSIRTRGCCPTIRWSPREISSIGCPARSGCSPTESSGQAFPNIRRRCYEPLPNSKWIRGKDTQSEIYSAKYRVLKNPGAWTTKN